MKKKGFTLVELLVVIAVIAILFVVILSKVDFATDRAKDSGVLTDFRSYEIGVQQTIRENGMEDSWTTADFNAMLNSNLDKKLRFTLVGTEYRSTAKNPYGFSYVIKKELGEIKVFSIKKQGEADVVNLGNTNVYAAEPYSVGKVLVLGVTDGIIDSDIEKLGDNTSVLAQATVSVGEPPEEEPEDPPVVVHTKPVAVITMTPANNLKTNTDITWSYASSTAETGATIVNAEWNNALPKFTTVGTYTVGLRVIDSNGLWSDWIYQEITVTDAPLVWTQRTLNIGITESINGVAYGNGTYVGVGSKGKIVTSSDGVTWTSRTSPFSGTQSSTGIAFGNGKFIAVAPYGEVAISTDGINWSLKTGVLNTGNLSGIAFGNGVFVITSYTGHTSSSTDGITWTAVTRPFSTSAYGAVYGGGQFVAVGNLGNIITSPNGTTWTLRTSPFGTTVGQCEIYSVTYGNGLYVAAGNYGKLATSTDGITWTLRDSKFGTTAIKEVAYGNGMYVAVGSLGKIATSNDGINWTLQPIDFSGGEIYHVSYVNSIFVATGGQQRLATMGL